jgi:hypothetical protein
MAGSGASSPGAPARPVAARRCRGKVGRWRAQGPTKEDAWDGLDERVVQDEAEGAEAVRAPGRAAALASSGWWAPAAERARR